MFYAVLFKPNNLRYFWCIPNPAKRRRCPVKADLDTKNLDLKSTKMESKINAFSELTQTVVHKKQHYRILVK